MITEPKLVYMSIAASSCFFEIKSDNTFISNNISVLTALCTLAPRLHS